MLLSNTYLTTHFHGTLWIALSDLVTNINIYNKGFLYHSTRYLVLYVIAFELTWDHTQHE